MNRIIKRTLLLSLLLSILFTFSYVAYADSQETTGNSTVIASGTCGTNLTWELDVYGTLTISGSGEMDNYDALSEVYAPWYKYNEDIETVIINNGLTSIGNFAFYFTSPAKIIIPTSVKSIGKEAFEAAYNLTSIVFTGNAPLISEEAFVAVYTDVFYPLDSTGWDITVSGYGGTLAWYSYQELDENGKPIGVSKDISNTCGENLTWELNENGTLIISGQGDMIRNPWSSLGEKIREVFIDEGVTGIADYAFYNCSSLRSITIPERVTHVGDWAFARSGLTSIIFTGDAPEIQERALSDLSANVYYPDEASGWDTAANSYGGNVTWYSYRELDENGTPVDVTKITSGRCGENLTWELDENGILTIIGNGNIEKNPWSGFSNEIREVVLRSGITGIGSYAFSDCIVLTSINIPDTVTSIGDHAFYNCSLVNDIRLPSGITSIGRLAFYNCRNLTSIEIPSGVTQVEDYVFCNCRRLLNIQIPSGVTYIGHSAFSGCGATTIEIPSSVTKIGDATFQGCENLESIEIPAGVTSIGEDSFCACNSLESIVFEGNAPDIAKNAFRFLNLNVYYPVSSSGWECAVSGYGGNPAWYSYQGFDEDGKPTGITRITSGSCGDNLTWTLDENGILTISGEGNMKTNPWSGFSEEICEVVIGNGVASIGEQAFCNCSSLVNVGIPSSVTSIGEMAFEGCSSLISIEIPSGVTNIGYCAFAGCSNLTSLDFQQGLMKIGEFAFNNCTGLTGIEIPSSVAIIGESAFDYCSSLERVIFTGDAPKIGTDAFRVVTTSVYYPHSASGWENIISGYGGNLTWYSYQNLDENGNPTGLARITSGSCGENMTWNLDEDGILSIIGEGAMTSCPWSGLYEEIREVVIDDGVTSIVSYAFSGCNSLVSVDIPSSVTQIGGNVFYGCSSLTRIVIPSGVTSIGFETFGNCINLTSIIFTGNAPTINGNVFWNVSSAVYYPLSASGWENEAGSSYRYECSLAWYGYLGLDEDGNPTGIEVITSGSCGENLTWNLDENGVLTISGTGIMDSTPWSSLNEEIREIILNEGITNIRLFAFSGCSNVSNIVIPSSVTSIEGGIFLYCYNLNSIIFTGDAPSIYDNAFMDLTCTAYYPINARGWETVINNSFRGAVVWRSYQNLDANGNPTGVARITSGSCGENLTWELDESGVLTITGVGAIGDMDLYTYYFPWSNFPEEIVSVQIGEGVTSMGRNAFSNCFSLKNVEIPSSVTNIGEGAFAEVSKVVFYGDAPDISMNAFANVPLSAFYPITARGWENAIDGYGGLVTWYSYQGFDADGNLTGITKITSGSCGDNLTWDLDGNGVLTISGEGEMTRNPWSGLYDEIKEVVFDERITSIKEEGFLNCSSLINIELPAGLTSIGESAFSFCSSLTSIVIPAGISKIETFTFNGCSNLRNIDIPSGVTSIGTAAFQNCSSLTNIEFPSSITSIGRGAFNYCRNLKSIRIPPNLTAIERGTFSNCSSLINVEIPLGVTRVGYSAFSNCSSLTDIIFTGNAPAFDNYDCFENVTATAYYSSNTSGWTDVVKQNYGGEITWVALPVEDSESAGATYAAAKDYYFGNSTEPGIDTDALNAVAADLLSSYQSPATGSLPDGITYEGASLTLEDTVMVRHFFTVSGDVKDYTFKLGGTTVEPVQRGQYYTVDIAGIPFSALNQPHTIEVISGSSQWSMSYCPLSYAYKALAAGTDDNLCTLMKAMYLYFFALNAS